MLYNSSDISLVWSQCDQRHPRSHGGSGEVQYPYIKSQNASKYLKRLGYYVLYIDLTRGSTYDYARSDIICEPMTYLK